MKRLLSRLTSRRASKPSPDRDSRRFRPPASEPVEVQIVGRNSIDVLNARDISVTGIGVHVPHRFEGCDIDSEVELVITLPSQRPFVARGRIRHETRQDGRSAIFGIQFTRLSVDHVARLRSYIDGGLASVE